MEQAHHCSFKVCCLQQRIKTNGIKPVACTTAHLMHPRNRMNKMNKKTGPNRRKERKRNKQGQNKEKYMEIFEEIVESSRGFQTRKWLRD